MKFFNKIMTTTAVVSLLIAGTSAVYAMDKGENAGSKPASPHVKMRYTEVQGEPYLELNSVRVTSTSTVQEEPTSSSSSATPPPMNQADAILSLLGTLTQELPNIAKILKEDNSALQPQRTPLLRVVDKGQELLKDPNVLKPLRRLANDQKVEEWGKGLSSISQTGFTPHDWERNRNQAVCGISDVSRRVMQTAFDQAFKQGDRTIIKKVVQDPELLKNWMSKADRFPRQNGVVGTSMEEMLNFEKAEYEKSQS